MKNRYQVIIGRHREGKTTYEKGQIVESESDLCLKFVGKFTDLGPVHEDEPKPKRKAKPVVEEVDDEEEIAEEVEEEKPAPKAKAKKKKAVAKKAAETDDDWED